MEDSLIAEDSPEKQFELVEPTAEQDIEDPIPDEFLGLKQKDTRLAGKEMIVYPNPGTGNFKVDLLEFSDQLYEMTIMNAAGQLIDKKTFFATDQIEVDLTGYEKGIYFIEMKVGEALFRQKIVLQ
jgi:hypothetical protein